MKATEYEKYVMDYLINDIKERFGFKTKKEARKYLFAAIAYNTVTAEINDKINFLLENPDRMGDFVE